MNKRTLLDYKLSCISEEAGEIVQAISKATRFGMFDVNPETQNTAWVQIRHELHDLIAAYEMFCDEFDRVPDLDRYLIDNKKERSLKYIKYAQSTGHLEK